MRLFLAGADAWLCKLTKMQEGAGATVNRTALRESVTPQPNRLKLLR
jgi:hypothetical protein